MRSSRRLERECQRNVELMWLLNRLAPDHKTIAEFRRREGTALRAVAAAFVRFCRGQALIRGEWLAIDGSKFEAVASRKAVLSRERLLREQAALERRVTEYLEQLDGADASEGDTAVDAAAVREALEVLRQQQAQGRTQGLSRLEALGTSQFVTSEPEAKQMKGHGPACNVQTVVDAEHGLIVTHVPANRAVNNQGDGTLCDRRCFTYDQATDTMRCTAGPRRFVARHLHEAALQRMQARATPELMRLRRCVVEHPFAALKYRIFEKPRFVLRGRWGAGTEMSLASLVWNLKRAMAVLGATELRECLACD